MQEIESHTAILVTASAAGDDVRRDLIGRGILLAGSTATLAQLRRSLVRSGSASPIILCITLDGPTLRRHGRALTRFLDDRASFAAPVHAIGLMPDGVAPDGWASVGCDAHATTLGQFQRLLRRFAAQSVVGTNRFAKVSASLAKQRSSQASVSAPADVEVNVLRRSNDLFSPHAQSRRAKLRRPRP